MQVRIPAHTQTLDRLHQLELRQFLVPELVRHKQLVSLVIAVERGGIQDMGIRSKG